jgi:hypothetical protein
MSHRRTLTPWEVTSQRKEEEAYEAWCRTHRLDPADTESAVAYEGRVGYLYIEYEPYAGEHR